MNNFVGLCDERIFCCSRWVHLGLTIFHWLNNSITCLISFLAETARVVSRWLLRAKWRYNFFGWKICTMAHNVTFLEYLIVVDVKFYFVIPWLLNIIGLCCRYPTFGYIMLTEHHLRRQLYCGIALIFTCLKRDWPFMMATIGCLCWRLFVLNTECFWRELFRTVNLILLLKKLLLLSWKELVWQEWTERARLLRVVAH